MENPAANRPPARERFASEVAHFDLNALGEQLESEGSPSHLGHRQIALHKHEKLTIALFAFEVGGGLPNHKANGTVSIQVVRGRLAIHAASEDHHLGPQEVLVLAPGVEHSVEATEQTLMLLTVCLE